MLTIPRWKYWSVLFTCFLGFVFALPNVLSDHILSRCPSWFQNKINLGLELRGGSHLQLEVDLKAVAAESLSQLLDDTRAALRREKIGYMDLSIHKENETPSLIFKLVKIEDKPKAESLIQGIDKILKVSVDDQGIVRAFYEPVAFEKRNHKLVEQSIEVIRRRVDETGTTEPLIQTQGKDRIILQLPGIQDPSEVRKKIGKTAKMTFRLVNADLPFVPAPEGEISKTPIARPGVEYLPEVRRGLTVFVPVNKKVLLTGETLMDSRVIFVENGQPAVSFKFNSVGAKKFAQISKDYLKQRLAIVLDNQVISTPELSVVIASGQGYINGDFTVKSAEELALLLRAGALPAPLKVIDERTIGPSLGSDSITHGQQAVLVAFLLVATFMTLSYALFGVFANVALIFNVIFLFTGLSLLQATLTLPGIAGIALTIGMAVDANVLIYERIKEELRAGLRPVNAVDAGYKRAMMTIIDSNLTTLFGAAVLYEFGSGPIRGFAVTLALGIMISLFTSLSLSRILIVTWLKKRKTETLPI